MPVRWEQSQQPPSLREKMERTSYPPTTNFVYFFQPHSSLTLIPERRFAFTPAVRLQNRTADTIMNVAYERGKSIDRRRRGKRAHRLGRGGLGLGICRRDRAGRRRGPGENHPLVACHCGD